MVPLFSLSLPLLRFSSRRSLSLGLSLPLRPRTSSLVLCLSLSLSLSPASTFLFLSLLLSFSLSLIIGGSFSGEGTPRWSHESRRLLLSPCTAFLPFRSLIFLPPLLCSALARSLVVAQWLVHWFHRCTGPGFVFFLSNYTVTCNRPCQLAAPFFRFSPLRASFFFFSPLSLAGPDVACNPFEGIAVRRRRKRWGGEETRRRGRGRARERSDPPINPAYPSNQPPFLRSDTSELVLDVLRED